MESARSFRPPGRGPFRVDQLRPGDPYELSDGHAIVAEPSGRRHARHNLAAGSLIDTDPAVEAAGVDAGFKLDEATLRAPDVSTGNLPDQEGFAIGPPALALEYVERGRDEADLERKVAELESAGTQVIWVVRLGGERRVEVHRPGEPTITRVSGEDLVAPGILRNAIPVDALYDRALAHDLTLRNLLQRHGYESLDAVRDEGHVAGAVSQARARLRRTLELRGIAIDAAHEKTIAGCSDLRMLDLWLDRALTAAATDDVLRST